MPDRAQDPAAAPTRFGELVGRAPAMRALFVEGRRLADLDLPVLVTGEAGTGKDMLARTLHAEGRRRGLPFVAIDCGVVPARDIEFDLFGRAEGATRGRAGALELAGAGTLLLDEPSELPRAVQERLSIALTSRTFSRIDGGATLPLALRLVTASKRKLAVERDRGRLAPALFDAIAGQELALPALRDRREDIPLIAQAVLERAAPGLTSAIVPAALQVLALHDWPGNVRELRNVVERFAHALERGDPNARKLGSLLLDVELAAGSFGKERRLGPDAASFEPGVSYREERARFEAAFEQRYVAWLLERHDGNFSAAARAAEMDRKYLYKLAKKHGLKSSE